MASRLREARERAGLTQAELALRAGVSRQLVGAAEAGRHAPSVATALRLARALGASVEELFAASGDAIAAPGLAEGTAVAVARVGDRLVAHALEDLAAGDGAWAAADGVVAGGEVRLLPGARTAGLAVMGCDPLLGLCGALIGAAGPRRLLALSGTSGAAAEALAAGRVHGAVVHGPEGALPAAPPGVERVHMARWRVGLGVPRGRDGSLEALLASGAPVIQRAPGAASQEALLRASGGRLPPSAGRATGHLDAARRAALTGAPAVTFEPAARRHGLAFVALEDHAVELWIDRRWMEHPGTEALLALLRGDALRTRLASIGGYDLEGAGVPAAA